MERILLKNMNRKIFSDLKPIFIVGCPRSGTTILASLLNSHSEIAAATETHFFNFISKQKKYEWREFDENQMRLMLDESRIQDFCNHAEVDPQDLIKYFVEEFGSAELSEHDLPKDKFYRKKIFDILIRALLTKKNKLRFCEKTPQHLLNVEEILELYPNARFINIVRDGRDVVNSLLKMPWRPGGLINNSRFWKQYVEKGLDLDVSQAPENFMTIRFEDLIKKSEETMQSICSFVGVQYEKTILQKAGLKEAVFTDWETNWKHKSSNELDSSRIGAWKKELSDQDQVILTWHQKNTLEKLGYHVDKLKIDIFDIFRIIQEYTSLFIKKIVRVFSHVVN